MKILFNCQTPFLLAHGGHVIQIQRTMAALNQIGIEAEPLRWWDECQTGNLIHYIGVAPQANILLARAKRVPLVMTNLFSAACNRTDSRLRRQGWFIKTFLKLPLGESIKLQLNWRCFAKCNLNIVGLEAERRVLQLAYGVPHEKTAVVPLGLDELFLKAGPGKREADYLISVGTITRQKNTLELAKLARMAQVPILFVGKPYSETDAYWREFLVLVDGRWVRHKEHIDEPSEMVTLLHSARGAVMMSDYENWSLTAHEAVACGLPLLLPDQKWSRERFGNQAHYFESIGHNPKNVIALKQFYDETPKLSAPNIKLYRWGEVATQLKAVYQKVLEQKLEA